MSLQSPFKLSPSETRVFNAVSVDMEGRFMTASGAEHPCRIAEMSTGAMKFATPAKPALGEKIIAYLTELGRFEGAVESLQDDGFTIGMTLTEARHKKLAEQLVWFANRDVLDMPDSRRHKRIVPLMQWTLVRLPNGKERMAKINDISQSGVNIEANVSLQNVTLLVGSQVGVGSKQAVVKRLVPGGFVAEFTEPFGEGELNESTKI